MASPLETNLEALTEQAITDAIEREKERVIQLATKEFETSLRKIIAKAAVEIHSIYSMERLGADLVIKVRIQ